jgi:hypothetical protein
MYLHPDRPSDTGSVTCPEGSRAIGGGLFTQGDVIPGAVLGESGPTPSGDGWQIRVNNPQHADADLEVRALCDFDVRDYQIVEGPPTRVAPNQYNMAIATCADGRQAVGGGWHVDAVTASASQSLPYKVNPSANWLTVISNPGPDPARVTTVVVCARVDSWTQKSGERVAVQPGGTADASASCPAGLRVAGPAFHTDTVQMTITRLNGGGDGWSATVLSHDPQPRQAYVVAVCTA